MSTFFLALLVVIVSMLGLAVGVLSRRAPLTGSCGGLSCMPGTDCDACSAVPRNTIKGESND